MGSLKAPGIIGIICLWAAASVSVADNVRQGARPSGRLVSKWSGEGDAKDSAGNHHGRVVGAVKYAKGMSGKAFDLDGKSYIDLGNPSGLRITGNQTVSMWLKPARLGVRQNPLAKAFGGEMTLTLECAGDLNYIYGISGRNYHPYAAHSSGPCFKVGCWTHMTIVRNFEAQAIRFYIDGVLRKEYVPSFTETKASKSSMYIGKGYVENYIGLIDEVCLWNRALTATEVLAVVSDGELRRPRISRNAKMDIVRTNDDSVLLGTIERKDWSITTSYGKFKIPAERVVEFTSKSSGDPATGKHSSSNVRMVLVDRQVLAGKVSAPVRLKLSSGQILKIPIDQIRQCGYRISPTKPLGFPKAGKDAAKFPATVLLSSGDRLAWASSGVTIRFKSVCGMLDIRSENVSSIVDAAGDMWRVHLKDSSLITGTLAPEKIKLKLKLGQDISVSRRDVKFLAFPVQAAGSPDAATVLLGGGGRLSGKLKDQKLTVQTDYGLVSVSMADVCTIERLDDGQMKLTTPKALVLTGRIPGPSLAMTLGSGGKLNVPIEQIDHITVPLKLPTETTEKIKALIVALGDKPAATRKAAADKLVAMGTDAIIVLRHYRSVPSPLRSKEVREVIGRLEIRVKPKSGPKSPKSRFELRGERLIPTWHGANP